MITAPGGTPSSNLFPLGYTPASTANSMDSFAQQLATAIEARLGEVKTGSHFEIDVQSGQDQSLKISVKNLTPATVPQAITPPASSSSSAPASAPSNPAPATASFGAGDLLYQPGSRSARALNYGVQDEPFLEWLESDANRGNLSNVTVAYDGNKNIVSYSIAGNTYTADQLAAAVEQIGRQLHGMGGAAGLNNLTADQQSVYLMGTAALNLPGSPVTSLPINAFVGNSMGITSFTPPTVAGSFNASTGAIESGFNPDQMTSPAEANAALAAIKKFHPDAALYQADRMGSGPGFYIDYGNEPRRDWVIVYGQGNNQTWVDPSSVLANLDSKGNLTSDVAGITGADLPIAAAQLLAQAS